MKKQIQKIVLSAIISIGLPIYAQIESAQKADASVRLVPLTSDKMYSVVLLKPDLSSAPRLAEHLGSVKLEIKKATEKMMSEALQNLVVAGEMNTIVAKISQTMKTEFSSRINF